MGKVTTANPDDLEVVEAALGQKHTQLERAAIFPTFEQIYSLAE